MEVTVFESLASAIATTHDAELLAALSAHKRQTDHHARRLEERLHAHGHEAANAKDLSSTQNRREEEAMAAWVAVRWDRFVDLTLDPATRDG